MMTDSLRIDDFWKFLFGYRVAIAQFGRWGSAPWLGALFVLSAGFAREYDRSDLLHEPWHLLLPFAASVVTSFLLYGWLFLECWRSGARTLATFFSGYWQFLGWYWLTAPLAWLYAIPYEQFLSPLAATQFNYLTLAVVAIWRVVLMIRVAHVAYGMSVGRAAVLVLAFADVIAFIAVNVAPKPIFDVMAGVRLTDEESFIQGIWLLVTFFSFWIGLALLLASASVFAVPQPRTAVAPSESTDPPRGERSLWGIAVAGLVLWVPLLFWMQPLEQRRWNAERMLRADQVERSLIYLSQYERSQLPAHFNPPPRLAYRESKPDLAQIVVIAQKSEVADWVRALFEAKWETQISGWGYYRNSYSPGGYTDEQLRNLLSLIKNRADRQEIAHDILRRLDRQLEEPSPEKISEERARLIDQFRRIAEEEQAAEIMSRP